MIVNYNHCNLSEAIELLQVLGFRMDPIPDTLIEDVQGKARIKITPNAAKAWIRHRLTNYDRLRYQFHLTDQESLMPFKRAVNMVIDDALARHHDPRLHQFAQRKRNRS